MNDAAALANWEFIHDDYGDWMGVCVNGRRTALKGSLKAAEQDARDGRVVCRNWPNCPHRDPDACTRAIAAARRQRRAA